MLANLPPSQLRDLLESLGACAFVVDILPDGTVRFAAVNRRLERLIGADRPIVGKRPEDFLPSEAAAAVSANYRRCAKTRACVEYDEELPMPSGRHWWHTVLSPLFDDTGRVVRVLGVTTEISRQVQTEQALRRSEALFRRMADAAPMMIWMSDADDQGVYFNKTWLDFTGRTLEQERGYGWLDSVHPDDRDALLAVCEPSFRDRRPFRTEFRLRCRDGRYRWVLDTGVPMVSDAGRFDGMIGSCIDITDHRQAEAALRRSEERFRAIFRYAGVGIVVAALDSRIVMANPAFHRMLGYPDGGLIGRSWVDVTHPDDVPGNLDLWEHVKRGDRDHYVMTKRYVRGDGGNVWAEATVTTVRGPDGRAEFTIGMIADITERKRDADALRRRTAELQTVLDAVPAAIWIGHDPDCRRITCSRAGYEILRMPCGMNPSMTPESHPPPTHFRVLRNGSEVAPHELPLQRAARGEEIRDFEEEVVFDDGTSCHLFGNARPLYSSTGRPRGAVGAFVDITDRKRAETALRRAKEDAERASAAKTRFLAAASHDLRQPMQSMQIYVNLLGRRLAGSEDRDVLGKIDNALTAQGELLDALLDISRLDAGLVTPRPRTLPLAAVLQRAADASAPVAEEKGLSVRVVPTTWTIRSDPVLLDRIVQNLVVNAVRYTHRGRILIGCRGAGDVVRLQVWDTGVGIAPEDLPYIFEEFYQVDNPARDRRKGLGLGLSIVKRLADLLGHGLSVRSRPGRGSVFEVTLPAALPEAPAAVPEQAAARAEAHGVIVVIDDEPDVLDALQMIIESWGFRVAAATEAAAALDRLRALGEPPALILADHRLRGSTGCDAIALLRRETGAAVPGIILTGDTSPDRLKQAHAAGLVLLHKPVRPAALRAAVDEALSAAAPVPG